MNQTPYPALPPSTPRAGRGLTDVGVDRRTRRRWACAAAGAVVVMVGGCASTQTGQPTPCLAPTKEQSVRTSVVLPVSQDGGFDAIMARCHAVSPLPEVRPERWLSPCGCSTGAT